MLRIGLAKTVTLSNKIETGAYNLHESNVTQSLTETIMKLKLIAATALVATLATHSANALVHQRGVVESVDASAKTFVVSSKQGRSEQYRLADNAKVIVDGKARGFEALAVNQQVALTLPSQSNDYVKARIMKIDLNTGIAVIKPFGSKKTVNIQLTKTTKVGGKVDSVSELAEGQIIKARYRNSI